MHRSSHLYKYPHIFYSNKSQFSIQYTKTPLTIAKHRPRQRPFGFKSPGQVKDSRTDTVQAFRISRKHSSHLRVRSRILAQQRTSRNIGLLRYWTYPFDIGIGPLWIPSHIQALFECLSFIPGHPSHLGGEPGQNQRFTLHSSKQ